jgi:DNA-binding FrmR family transcriptional regulator
MITLTINPTAFSTGILRFTPTVYSLRSASLPSRCLSRLGSASAPLRYWRRDKPDLLKRLRSAKGHVAALERMIACDAPCAAVLLQALAVRGALAAASREIIRAYLLDENCGLRARNRARRMQAWQELSAVMREKQRP